MDLDLIVQNYEDDRKDYWSGDEVGAKQIDLIDRIAATLLEGAGQLTAPPTSYDDPDAFSWDQVQFLQKLPSVGDRIFERVEIDVAWQFSVGTRSMAARCLELAQMVVQGQPNHTVLRFLGRLSRCYIAGFYPECVMLCRAVIENAVAEAFDKKGIPLPATSEGQSPMRTRLAAAERFDVMSPATARDAAIVWRRGNKAVHDDPEATQDVLGTIRLTMSVLAHLYAGRS